MYNTVTRVWNVQWLWYEEWAPRELINHELEVTVSVPVGIDAPARQTLMVMMMVSAKRAFADVLVGNVAAAVVAWVWSTKPRTDPEALYLSLALAKRAEVAGIVVEVVLSALGLQPRVLVARFVTVAVCSTLESAKRAAVARIEATKLTLRTPVMGAAAETARSKLKLILGNAKPTSLAVTMAS